MAFYDLSKADRIKLVSAIHSGVLKDLKTEKYDFLLKYFSDDDTYVRKSAYLAIGRIYRAELSLQKKILQALEKLLKEVEPKIRQTAINASGEIGIYDFEPVEHFFDTGLFDKHHSVRNAVIGSIKKMGEKNPKPVLFFSKKYLHHKEPEIRREICHGIELRGRTHPEDILPILEELQHDSKARVRNTLVHVLGQIAYKQGCLEKVIQALNHWGNKQLVKEASEEILDVHIRYKKFSSKTYAEAKAYIKKNLQA